MLDQHTFLDLVSVAYDAVDDSERWPAYLARVAGAMQADWVGLVAQGAVGLPPELTPIGAACPTLPAGGDQVPAPSGYWCAAGPRALLEILCHDCRAACAIAAVRRAESREFDSDERQAFAMLVPHLRHALTLSRHLQRASSERAAALTALDRISCGVMLVDPTGSLLAANAGARDMLARGDGLRREGNRVVAAGERQRGMLADLVQRLAHGAPAVPDGTASLPVPRRGNHPALLVRIVAADRPASGGACADERQALLLIAVDPECRPVIDEPFLSRAYGLTKSEAHFAALLAAGHSLDQIADRLCVSRNTVRTHLQHVYLKTDTRRQGELIRLLLAGFSVASQPRGRGD